MATQLMLVFEGRTARVTREYWEWLLHREGMAAEPKGTPHAGPSARHRERDAHASALRARIDINTGILDRAKDYYWKHRWPDPWEKRVWGLFAIDGLSIRDIADKLRREGQQCSKTVIGRLLIRHKRKAGIVK